MSDSHTAEPGRIRVERRGAVAWITLDRPERLNALVGTMRDDLAAAVETASADPAVGALVITGAGRAFCAGADVDVMARLLEQDDEATFAGYVEAGVRVVRAIRAARQPVIAAVNGVAAGAGASLAVACDLRIASEAAAFGFTFNRIGLHPDWGATFTLPRLVGVGAARELIYTARMVRAEEALTMGLVERTVAAGSLLTETEALASELAAKPPLALALAKRSMEEDGADALEQAMRREAEAQLRCFRSRDAREGIAAFQQKRAATFRGE